MRKPKVGDKLFLVQHDKNSTKGSEVFVIKVGEKCFYVQRDKTSRWGAQVLFYVSNWQECVNYASRYTLYEDHQAWKDEIKAQRYISAFRSAFEKYSGLYNSTLSVFTLDQLQSAAKTLGIVVKS